MHLEKIEIENFKSYLGLTTIGPFDNFTCIIGPNGSGKSNILDALTFALNVPLSSLRVNSLKEVISNGCEKCCVKILLTNKIDGKFVCFSKSFDITNSCTYEINNQKATAKRYNGELEKINIFSQIRNFVVYQGILLQDQVDLLNVIESISGSINYKNEYEKLKENFLLSNRVLSKKFERKKDIMQDMKEAGELKEKEIKFVEFMHEKEATNKEAHALNYKIKQKELEKISLIFENLKSEIDGVKNNERFRNCTQEILGLKKEIAGKQRKFYEMEMELRFMQEPPKNKQNYEELHKIKAEIEEGENFLKTLPENIDYSKYITKSNVDPKKAEKSFKDDLEELIAIYNKQTKDLSLQESKLILENFEKITKAEEISLQIKRIKNKQKKIEDENAEISRRNKLKEERKREIEQLISECKKKTSKETLENYNKVDENLKEAEKELNKITRELLLNNARKSVGNKKLFLTNVVENLKAIFPGVHGKFSSLIKPTQKKYEIPISVLISKYDQAVVVEDEKTAISCLRYLKETKSCRLTFLCLDQFIEENYQIYTSDGSINPMQCITVDEKYENLAKFVLKSAVIVENAKTVREIKNIRKICTLEGTLFQKSGLITGGSLINNKFEENVLDELAKERSKILNLIKVYRNKKEAFSEINIIADKIQSLEEEREKIKIDEFLPVEEIKTADLENELRTIKDSLREFEISQRFIKESLKVKEREILFPFLSLININSLFNYKKTIEDLLKKDEITANLEILKKKLQNCCSDLEITEKVAPEEKYKKIYSINNQLIKMGNELEKLKQNLKSKMNSIREFDYKLNIENEKLMNISLSKNKLEEEIKDDFSMCQIETDIRTEADIDLIYLEITQKYSKPADMRLLTDLRSKLIVINQNLIKNAPAGSSSKDSLQSKYLKFNREFESAKEAAILAKEHFNEINSFRKEAFKECFVKLQGEINEIYRKLAYSELLKNTNDFNTGNIAVPNKVAYVISEGDPFNVKNSLKFYVMPPGKGFVEFKNLSGGEKSIAMLSFLFALHKVPPFYVLDEVDAALDKENVTKLIQFIKNESDQEKQFIVVSLKNYFFRNADSLIGIYRCPEENKSKVLTLRLNK
ncbi:hypothetical protein NUSPORA_00787 [Nucleospora cyclopteri]